MKQLQEEEEDEPTEEERLKRFLTIENQVAECKLQLREIKPEG